MITAQNAREALAQTAQAVLNEGKEVRPRGMLTRELEHFALCVEDPTDWGCALMNANWSGRVVAVEGLQLVGGFSDPTETARRVPALGNFLNEESGEFDGAYGPRAGCVLPAAMEKLRADSDTRQAIIPIYYRTDTWMEKSKDYPCTLTLHFLIREGRLNLHVSMRSNDVDWGLKHDMGQFMLLQCSVANLLGVPVGRYFHTSNSMHLYERSFEWARMLDTRTAQSTARPRGGITSDGTPAGMMQRARDLFYDAAVDSPTSTERFLREAAQVA